MIAFIISLMLSILSQMGLVLNLFSEPGLYAVIFYAISTQRIRSAPTKLKHHQDQSSSLSHVSHILFSFILGITVDIISDGMIGMRGLLFPMFTVVLGSIARHMGLNNSLAQAIACACCHLIVTMAYAMLAYRRSGVHGIPDISLSIFVTALLCPVVIHFMNKAVSIAGSTNGSRSSYSWLHNRRKSALTRLR